MSTSWGQDSAQNTTHRRKRWLIIAAVVLILLILLLIFAPAVLMLLSIPAFIIALIALIAGGLRWARIPNRRVAGGLLGGIFVLFLISSLVFGTNLPPTTADRDPVAATPSPTATIEPSPVTLLGEVCDADDLVQTEDTESLYCDENGAGNLVWVSTADHEAAEVKAQEEADRKAAAEKAAAEKAAAEKAAAEKAAAEKAAEKKAAEKKAAEKKAQREAAAEKAATEKAAAQKAAEKRATEKAAAPKKTYAPAPTPKKTQAPAPESAGTDPRFGTCKQAIAAGYGPYVAGRDTEYNWYRDSDGDGVNCER